MRRAPGEATGFAAAGLPEQIELSRASCTEVCTHDVLGRLRMRGGTTDHPSRGDRGFESCSLQRRVHWEPDLLPLGGKQAAGTVIRWAPGQAPALEGRVLRLLNTPPQTRAETSERAPTREGEKAYSVSREARQRRKARASCLGGRGFKML